MKDNVSDKKVPQINKVMMTGNLCRDPECRKTSSGVPVVNFRIASSRRFRDGNGQWREETCFIGVVAWQRLAESVADCLHKGSSIFVEGELQSKDIEMEGGGRRTTIEIHAHKIQFLDRREREEEEEPFDDAEAYNR